MPCRRSSPRSLLLAATVLVGTLPISAADGQSLRGSESSVNEMYERARSRGLTFFRTSTGVRNAVREGEFVRLTSNRYYRVARMAFPYVKPTTRAFVDRLAREYRMQCGEQLVVTSGVRPITRQPRNASDRSVHPTGMAIDLRKPSGVVCRQWLRYRLLELEALGGIEATEENRPPHFHIAVYSATRFALAESDAER